MAVAVLAAAIAVGVVEATKGSSHSSAAHTPAAALTTGASGTASRAGAATAARPGAVKVADPAAVQRSLREGVLTVVVDSPHAGVLSEQNTSIAQGAALAVEELNAAGGIGHHIRIKLLTQTLDGLSAAALRSKLSAEAAAALILPCDTSSQTALAEAGAQFGMLMVAPCNAEPVSGASDATYWPLGMSASEEAAGMGKYLISDNIRSAFVVGVAGSSYAQSVEAAFRVAAKAQGIELVGSASVSAATSDFAAVVKAIDSQSPVADVVYTSLAPPQVDELGAALKSAKVDTTVLGTTVMDTRGTLKAGAKGLEGASFTSYGFAREDSAASRFEREYRLTYNKPVVGAFPGLGFEAIRLIEAAAGKAHSASPPALQRALAGGLTLQGVALANRTYGGSADHNPTGEVAISKVYEGAFLPEVAVKP